MNQDLALPNLYVATVYIFIGCLKGRKVISAIVLEGECWGHVETEET